ncbi:hypothetical protein PGH46_06590 [Legionella pneumophila]|nr:hypothetical protein PGH46_06590 [Legionella pneumophila]
MVQFAKPSIGPPADCGRINLLIGRELGQYQNIIQKWIANLEDNAKQRPSNISEFKFGKTLGYLLLQSLKKQIYIQTTSDLLVSTLGKNLIINRH